MTPKDVLAQFGGRLGRETTGGWVDSTPEIVAGAVDAETGVHLAP